MIRVLMLDLGGTLASNDGKQLIPGAVEALTELTKLPLILSLVSDYTDAKPPTPETINALFQEYITMYLDKLGLTRFFQPVNQRVTLSTQIGIRKPDRRVFEAALRNLALPASQSPSLKNCLFITENEEHVNAGRKLGMMALQYGKDFTDWAQAPALIQHLVHQDA